MKKIIVMFTLCVLPFILSTLLPAQQPVKNTDWASWRFLLGEWVGEGGGNQPGQGAGGSQFYLALSDNILVRKNHSEFPATKDRPAFTHDDVTIIYPEAGKSRAIYFDNEGHVINYSAEFSEDHNTLTFVSDIQPSAPRFRLTYTKAANETLKLKFEIAPPGKPDAFSPYIKSVLRRK
ncbi:MAG TPA: hypothetical protein VK469_07755 [Candidatus Kapabacteria bacterium]|nr:hypothetical protein [Candidatus Kapabacteria bacterium]